MEPLYDSVLVAEFFRAKAFESSYEIPKGMIHKMLYFVYGLYLAKFDSPLLNEQPRAWPSGPVFLEIEKNSSVNGFHSVSDPRFDGIKQNKWLVSAIYHAISIFGKHSDEDFGWWLRHDRAPWRKATSKPDFMWNDVINEDDIKSYFAQYYPGKR